MTTNENKVLACVDRSHFANTIAGAANLPKQGSRHIHNNSAAMWKAPFAPSINPS